MRKWWEKEPIRFECQPGCLKCCIKPGVVYFDDADVRRAAGFLQRSIAKFKSEYLTQEDGSWIINVGEKRPCPFLTLKGCRIHETKPAQCGTYPFWRENLESRNHWKLAAAFCPGIDLGPMVPLATIKKFLKQSKIY